MAKYVCVLEAEVYADSAVEAAAEANESIKDPTYDSWVFDVTSESGVRVRVMDGKEHEPDMMEYATELFRVLRHAGYAVCLFTPEELNGADAKLVQDAMCERGHQAIEDLT